MSIQNIVRTENCCVPLYRGTVGTPLSTFTEYSLSSKTPACHKGSVWFKGELFTMHKIDYNDFHILKYNKTLDSWTEDATDLGGAGSRSSLPGMIVYKNKIYVFYDESDPTSYASCYHKIRGLVLDADFAVAPDTGGSRYYTRIYDKGITTYQDMNHIHDIVINKGVFCIAGSFGIYTNTPGTNAIVPYWEIQETGTNGYPLIDNQTSKSLEFLGHDLYCLFSNGTINKLSAVFSEEANLNDVITGNSGIITGVDLTGTIADVSIGYSCYLYQSSGCLNAFVNASGANGNGIVSFSSENGSTWVETTSSVVPLAWRNQIAHIKGCMDPSNNEQRIVLLNATDNASFEEFVFNGSGAPLTSLGSSTIANFYTYNLWNDDAIDVESENAPVVDLTTVTVNYTLYNQSSGVANVSPKYSIDNGGSWHDATRKTGMGSGLTNLPSETQANGGKEYIFIWDYRIDLGYSTDYTNVKMQFITSLV